MSKNNTLKQTIANAKAVTLFKMKMKTTLKKATDQELDIITMSVQEEYNRRYKNNKEKTNEKRKEKTNR